MLMAIKRENLVGSTSGEEDLDAVIASQSPWTSTGKVPLALTRDIERPLAQVLWRRLLNDRPHRFEIILGPRRVGKTTCMYQTVQRIISEGISPNRVWWLRLDHPLLAEQRLDILVQRVIALSNASAKNPAYLFFDELAYADRWDGWLKTFYDDRWPVKIVATSSATAALRNRALESGIGRWEEQHLLPHSLYEFFTLARGMRSGTMFSAEATLAATLRAAASAEGALGSMVGLRRTLQLAGGFPELLSLALAKETPSQRSLFDAAAENSDAEQEMLLESQRILRSDAVERAIYKDIPQAFGVHNPRLLERVLYSLAGQMTAVLAPASLCQQLGDMSQATFERYTAYLERAFLIFTLANYAGSETSRQRRGRKLYFVDGAVRSAALQRGLGRHTDLLEMGLLIENMAASHLYALSQQSQIRLSYWRDRAGAKALEVDFIYEDPAAPLAFEVGSSAHHSRAGLHAFLRRHPEFAGKCYLISPDTLSLPPDRSSDGIGTLPLDAFLLAVGSQAQRELQRRLGV
ncbi:MAG: ATP-binding protein [Phycisphaerae bacterium]